MKRQFSKKLSRSVILGQILLAIIPGVLWWTAIAFRSPIIETRCVSHPNSCTKEAVLEVDQLSLGMEDWKADHYSYQTQNTSGVLALLSPSFWEGALFLMGRVNAPAAIAAASLDTWIVFQTIAWNGLFTETSHLISQRPRPFVYSNPAEKGQDPAHYTSFYSGHTSFTAATQLALLLMLIRRKAPGWMVLLAAVSYQGFVLSTAYFRILAGRHFLTDVICGAIAGSLVAWGLSQWHKRKKYTASSH